MSEATPEPTEGAAAEGAAKPKATAGPPPLILGVVVVLALAAGASLGAMVVAPPLVQGRQKAAFAAAMSESHGKKDKKKKAKDKNKKDAKGEHGSEGKSPVYRIDNIIVNPAGTGGQRFLMCSVAVELEDEKLADTMREHEVEARDVVIASLEGQTLASLTAPGARDSVRARLVVALRPLLGEDGEDTEMRVFLPQFVIQ